MNSNKIIFNVIAKVYNVCYFGTDMVNAKQYDGSK